MCFKINLLELNTLLYLSLNTPRSLSLTSYALILLIYQADIAESSGKSTEGH